MINTVSVKRAAVAKIVAATFPDYSGRKFKVEAAERVTLSDLNWSGGSRSQYRTCTIDGIGIGSADKWNAVAPWSNRAEGTTHQIPEGAVVVRHSIFCGKDTGLTIYVHPASMPALLAAA